MKLRSVLPPLASLVTVSLAALAAVGAEPAGSEASPISWKLHRLGNFRSEASCVADFDGDSRLDVMAGPYLYLAPEFKPLEIRKLDGSVDEQGKGYFDDFSNIPLDVDGDGRLDVVTVGWFSQSVIWFRNTLGQPGLWPEGGRIKDGNIEAADLLDIDGDGKAREVLVHCQATMWCEAGSAEGKPALVAHVISDKKIDFGGGVGDVNGDGRPDVLRPEAWFEGPQDPRTGTWVEHPWSLGAADGKATHTPQILVYDVNADGLNDVITSHAHAKGIYWYQQICDGGEIQWKQHTIDDSWTQAHSLVLADFDGDGDLDLATGKRFLAHNGGDPGALDPPVVYWYQLQRDPAVRWQRQAVSEGQGIGSGMTISAADMDADGDPDLIVTGKWGGPVWFENQR